MRKRNRFPAGWNAERVRAVLEHYEDQADNEAVAEDEAAFRKRDQTVMVVPKELVPAITKLIKRKETIATGTRRLSRTLGCLTPSRRRLNAPPFGQQTGNIFQSPPGEIIIDS